MAGEFDLIAQYFAPLAGPEGLGLKDDAALLIPSPNTELVFTVDAMTAGIHFLADEAPDVIARRLMRVNMSDVAAKGAKPRGYLLTLALPPALDENWVRRFAEGLATDQEAFGVKVIGGDTVATEGPLVLSLTAIGEVPTGRMIRRGGAHIGDEVYVSGTIGDAAFGLEVAQGGHRSISEKHRAYLESRFRLPLPRLALGQALALEGLASAAADVSDGLLADAGHIATASGLDVEIFTQTMPLSDAARQIVEANDWLIDAMTGGDDYELVFTAASDQRQAVQDMAEQQSVPLTRIGRIMVMQGETPSVHVLGADGMPMTPKHLGYRHR